MMFSATSSMLCTSGVFGNVIALIEVDYTALAYGLDDERRVTSGD